MAISLRSPLPAFVLLNLFILLKKRKKGKGKKNLADQNHLSDEALILTASLWCWAVGSYLKKKKKRSEWERGRGGERGREREEKTVLGADDFSSPLHLATGSVRDWFIVKEIFFFYPWFHMVWTGLHVAQHASANVFSIRCLISRELASDEACWQHNGRENLRRLHQMAALLRHLGQNLVDGELAAGLLFFFSLFYFPSLFDKMSQTSHLSN